MTDICNYGRIPYSYGIGVVEVDASKNINDKLQIDEYFKTHLLATLPIAAAIVIDPVYGETTSMEDFVRKGDYVYTQQQLFSWVDSERKNILKRIKSGFFDLLPQKQVQCKHLEHDPPPNLHIPNGRAYCHICPSCDFLSIITKNRYEL